LHNSAAVDVGLDDQIAVAQAQDYGGWAANSIDAIVLAASLFPWSVAAIFRHKCQT